MLHAEGVIERIVFFDSLPKVDVALAPQLGSNVDEHLKGDLADKKEAVRDYNTPVKVCVEAADNASREMFEGMIRDQEGHADFLGSQLHAI